MCRIWSVACRGSGPKADCGLRRWSQSIFLVLLRIIRRLKYCVLGKGFGGALCGRDVGALAPATATSFFPGKALGAYGDAGAMFARDASDAAVWESIRWHGTDEARRISVRVGFNGRMDTFQAAILLEKLAIFDDELARRREIAAAYERRLAGLCGLQRHLPQASSGLSYFSLLTRDRDGLARDLKARGVPTAVYYATPLHRMPAFEAFAPEGGLPASESVADRILSLPMHPYLTDEQVDYICDAVEESLAHASV